MAGSRTSVTGPILPAPARVREPGTIRDDIRAMPRTFDDLGYYTLAGAAQSPRDLITEAHDAERLGLGWVFISERFNVKEAATLSGAVGAVSTTLQIATAATNHHTRHPIVTAVVRDDDAPPDRRSLHARPRARHRPADRGARPGAGHDGPARGLRRADAPAVARRDDPRPRRTGRALPVPAPRPGVRRGHPARHHGVRPEHAARSPAGPSTRSCCTRSSTTRRSPGASAR